MRKSRICITCPRFRIKGGVSNYFDVMRKYLTDDVHLFQIGSEIDAEPCRQRIYRLMKDAKDFNYHLKYSFAQYDLVHLNPSLDFRALIRDSVLLLLAKRYGCRVLVFIHGWTQSDEEIIGKYLLPIFRFTYARADAFVVLAKHFELKLREWGIVKPIFLETTPVDDELLMDFDLEKRLANFNSERKIQILFLARITKSKGIFDAIQTIYQLQNRFIGIRLLVAGDGPHLGDAKKVVEDLGLRERVEFLGHVSGEMKRQAFADSDLYLFPSTHGEGMPTSVLEAMAFGLPVITYQVGGLQDFFIDGEHGLLARNKDSREIVSLVLKLMESPTLFHRISRYNHAYARSRFVASQTAKRLENIYRRVSFTLT